MGQREGQIALTRNASAMIGLHCITDKRDR
jgi:hypothetical protein